MSPSSTVHGGQHDTKYVTFELLMHAAFAADEIWGFMLGPDHMSYQKNIKNVSKKRRKPWHLVPYEYELQLLFLLQQAAKNKFG